MDAEIPEHLPAFTVRDGVELRRWPPLYLDSPRVQIMLDAWRLKSDGIAPLHEPGLLWPTPLVLSLRVLDSEHARKG